jgi:hypothetical protein
MRTRSTDPGMANPPPETGGPSNNEQMATIETPIVTFEILIRYLKWESD